MAAKRVATSSVNWSALAERVPPSQKTNFLAFKTKSDKYLRSVQANPEVAPKIDWSFYKSKVALPGLVDSFQKSYESLNIPYPKDNLSASVEDQRKEITNDIAQFKNQSNERIQNHIKELEKIKSLLPYSEMTMEDFADAHPDLALDPINKPTFWPHQPEDQPENWKDEPEEKAH